MQIVLTGYHLKGNVVVFSFVTRYIQNVNELDWHTLDSVDYGKYSILVISDKEQMIDTGYL